MVQSNGEVYCSTVFLAVNFFLRWFLRMNDDLLLRISWSRIPIT